jgi:ABC-type methionine transport system ATPase subunit
VAIAYAVAGDPKVLLRDEITGSPDPAISKSILPLLKDIVYEQLNGSTNMCRRECVAGTIL